MYVAKCYPAWQCVVLDTLREMFKGNKDTLVDNKAVSVEMAKKPEVKKFMKKVMPFVAFTKEKVLTSGLSALDTSLPWDEMKVMLSIMNFNKILTHYPAGAVRQPELHRDHPGAGGGGPGPVLRPGGEGRGLQARSSYHRIQDRAKCYSTADQQPAFHWPVQHCLPHPPGGHCQEHHQEAG